jgi:hypothetical protein
MAYKGGDYWQSAVNKAVDAGGAAPTVAGSFAPSRAQAKSAAKRWSRESSVGDPTQPTDFQLYAKSDPQGIDGFRFALESTDMGRAFYGIPEPLPPEEVL